MTARPRKVDATTRRACATNREGGATERQLSVVESRRREARSSLGPVRNRDVALANYVSSLTGGAEEECVILRFDTRFGNESDATERMTFTKTEEGTWHSVDGYHIT